MATKPLSEEAIALTEKKMDMSLDDIIKMSKTDAGKKKQRLSIKSRGNHNGNHDRSFKVRQHMDSRSTIRQGVLAQKRSSFQGNFPLAAEAARKAANATFHNRPFNHRNAGNWNRTRPGGPPRRQGNASNGGNLLAKQQRQKQGQPQPQHQYQNQEQKRQKQRQHQDPMPRGEMIHNQKPKTLDSLFANMKEQRMRAFNRPKNGGNGRVGAAFNQPRQPWLRGRFGTWN